MSQTARSELLATVFSDYICPFCYIGDLRLERLREQLSIAAIFCLIVLIGLPFGIFLT